MLLLCWAGAALGIVDQLRRRFARFKLCAHFLYPHESFFVLRRESRFFSLFLVLAVLFEEFVEQHRVHGS